MTILKRCFWFNLFLFIWLSALPHYSAFSQQENIPFEAELADEIDVREEVDEQLDQTDPPERVEETIPTPVSHYCPFLPTLKDIIVPGKIQLDDDNIDLIYESQLDSGIKNFTAFALFLINKSQQAIEKKENDEAIRLAKAAIKSAPYLPNTYWALARAYGAENKINVYRVIKENLKGFWIAKKNFRSLLLYVSNIYFILYLAFFLTIIAFSFIFAGKYFRLLAYDIGGLFFLKNHALLGYLWAGILILFPIILGLGPLLIASYWFIIIAGYLTRKEKHVVWGISLLLILLPWCFGNAASMILANQPGIINLLQRANYEDWSPEVEKQLEAWLVDHPQDTSVIFTLGLINKKQKNYEKAEKCYNNLLEINPSDEKAIGNLANIYLAKRQIKKAEETYQKAIKKNSKIASFHYNLYRAYIELYKFLEAQQEQELIIARKIDPELIEHQEKIFDHTSANRMVIDETLSLKVLWNKAFHYSKEREVLASSLWRFFLKGVPYKYGIFVFIIFCFIISFLFFQHSQGKYSLMCAKCGQPMKKLRSGQSAGVSLVCSNCISIYAGDKKVNLQAKEKKMDQVKKYEKRQNIIWRFLTYALPGGGHLWTGSPWLAALYLFIFFCFVVKAVFWNGLLRDPLTFYWSGNLLKISISSILFLGFYAFSVWNSYHQRERFFDYGRIFRTIRGNEKEQKVDG